MHIDIHEESEDKLTLVWYVFDIDSDLEVRLVKRIENIRKTRRHKYIRGACWYGFRRESECPKIDKSIMDKVECEIIKRISWRL